MNFNTCWPGVLPAMVVCVVCLAACSESGRDIAPESKQGQAEQSAERPLSPNQQQAQGSMTALNNARVDGAPTFGYEVVNRYYHDPGAFTQGLLFHEGFLYEGTGMNGQSSIRKVELHTGEVVQMHPLPFTYFGEGITIFGDKLIQLTWRSHKAFVYDKKSFAPVGEFHYPTEGWGITHDGKQLIMSDGSHMLYFLDPKTYEQSGSIAVYDGARPVRQLNELEYIEGLVYANIWQSDRIARIDPVSGKVHSWLDFTGLLQPQQRSGREDVLNGIAWDAGTRRLFLTGKYWPQLFEVKIREE